MRVLFLTYYFPPDAAVGAIRAHALHDAFRRAGHEVIVITRRIEQAPHVPFVHRVPTLPNPRDLVIRTRDWLRRRKAVGPAAPREGAYRVPDNIAPWKRFLVAMAQMPDDYHGFIWPAVLRSVPHLLRGVDLVYTSGPPHSVHLAGLLIAHLTNVRWAAEFRDPWTDNAIQPRFGRSAAADRVRHWLERRCLRRANAVVTVTAAAARVLAPRVAGPVIVARNGIAAPPSADAGDNRTRSGERRILYMGNLYHQRDPRPLFHALASLREKGGLPPDGVRVDLFGDCAWFNGISVEQAARQAGVGDLVHLRGRVPLTEARRLTQDADILLLLAQDQPLQVPQKLYEYLAVKRPILAFADAGSETAAILQELGGHHLVFEDEPAQAEQVLARALHDRQFCPPSAAALDRLSAAHQMDDLVKALSGGH